MRDHVRERKRKLFEGTALRKVFIECFVHYQTLRKVLQTVPDYSSLATGRGILVYTRRKFGFAAEQANIDAGSYTLGNFGSFGNSGDFVLA
jgi:hypothetical protein